MTAGGSSWGWEGPSDRRFTVEFETGAIWQSRNDIHIPDNENGTRFDLRSLQGTSPDVHRRAELTWNVPPPATRFGLCMHQSAFQATAPSRRRFASLGGPSSRGSTVKSNYTFDSYSLTYRYLVHESEWWRWRIGATAFIRDGKVELR